MKVVEIPMKPQLNQGVVVTTNEDGDANIKASIRGPTFQIFKFALFHGVYSSDMLQLAWMTAECVRRQAKNLIVFVMAFEGNENIRLFVFLRLCPAAQDILIRE
ncbi:hypothetical protein CIHG_04415 [Coccidioides immitis H538.4]|uniref:Uncharacterized protein n=2 Tax=Coccidioides immitis TaxID=5501 RepID=A0A0J8RPA9_COCIT|nr:hypothetical protein CIRG_09348 [Coccidioides immitis RMSCC 2394]KMU86627.1 hypothetical protein CIHG_04415 [Coccidioides immitis H538.4]